MKYSRILVGTLFILNGFFTQASQVEVTLNQALKKAMQLEDQGDTIGAYYEVLSQIRVVHKKSRVNSVIQKIETDLTQIVDEVVVEHHETSKSSSRSSFFSKSSSAGFSLLGIGASAAKDVASYESSSHQSAKIWDVTKFIVQNPKEVQEFESRVSDELAILKRDLVKYLNEHEEWLVLRFLAIKGLQLADQLVQKGTAVSETSIQEMLQIVLDIRFIGQQVVTQCLKTSYVDQMNFESEHNSGSSWNYKSESAGMSFPLLFEVGGSSSTFSSSQFSNSFSNLVEKLAYEVITDCTSSLNHVSISPKETTYRINLSAIDNAITQWVSKLQRSKVIGKAKEVYSPTFGLPSYKN